jgi:hypothetical protein
MARPSDLLSAGLAALGPDPSPAEDRIVRAVAAMLQAKGKRKSAPSDDSKLAVAPRTLFETVRREAGDKVLCEPIDARWFGHLGTVLKSVEFTPDDLERLVAWLNAGGQATWPQGVPGFGHLIQRLPSWTALAREWDRRGRQELGRGRGSVGAASTPESTDFSAFQAPRLGG